MATNNPRISRSGVTNAGSFPLYTNSPEVNDFDPSLVRLIRGNSLSPLYLVEGDIESDDISLLDEFEVEVSEYVESALTTDVSSSSGRYSSPSLSDISIVSNSVVYDAAGNPSVTVVFKVKNSSGETLKGMNARIELV